MKAPIFFAFLLSLWIGPFSAAGAETAMPITSQQAVEVLRTSLNLRDVMYMLRTCATDPDLQPAALTYLDGPSRYDQMVDALRIEHPAEFEADPFAPPQKYWGGNIENIKSILTQNYRPETFPVFTHFFESDLAHRIGGADGNYLRSVIPEVKPGSPWESLLLDYLAYANRHLYLRGYENNNGSRLWIGVYNIGLQKFDSHWVTKDEEQSATKSGKEVSQRLFLDGTLQFMLLIKSDLAIQKFIQAAADPDCRETDILFALPALDRYDPKYIPVFGMALNRVSRPNKVEVVQTFLREDSGWSDAPSNLPSIDYAPPMVYPSILAFIHEIEGLNFTEKESQETNLLPVVNRAKTKVLDYYKKTNIPVPTDAELDNIIDSWKQLAAPKQNLKQVDSLASSTSSTAVRIHIVLFWLLYAVLGAIFLLGLVILLRKRSA